MTPFFIRHLTTSAPVFFMRLASSPTLISSGICTLTGAFLAISSCRRRSRVLPPPGVRLLPEAACWPPRWLLSFCLPWICCLPPRSCCLPVRASAYPGAARRTCSRFTAAAPCGCPPPCVCGHAAWAGRSAGPALAASGRWGCAALLLGLGRGLLACAGLPGLAAGGLALCCGLGRLACGRLGPGRRRRRSPRCRTPGCAGSDTQRSGTAPDPQDLHVVLGRSGCTWSGSP